MSDERSDESKDLLGDPPVDTVGSRPSALEALVAKAVADPDFLEKLVAKRSRVDTGGKGPLDPVEAAILDVIPEAQLRSVVDRFRALAQADSQPDAPGEPGVLTIVDKGGSATFERLFNTKIELECERDSLRVALDILAREGGVVIELEGTFYDDPRSTSVKTSTRGQTFVEAMGAILREFSPRQQCRVSYGDDLVRVDLAPIPGQEVPAPVDEVSTKRISPYNWFGGTRPDLPAPRPPRRMRYRASPRPGVCAATRRRLSELQIHRSFDGERLEKICTTLAACVGVKIRFKGVSPIEALDTRPFGILRIHGLPLLEALDLVLERVLRGRAYGISVFRDEVVVELSRSIPGEHPDEDSRSLDPPEQASDPAVTDEIQSILRAYGDRREQD